MKRADERLRQFLLAQDPAWLTDQLLTAARADPVLRTRLDAAAAVHAGNRSDGPVLRKRLASAIKIREFVRYREARSYFRDIAEVLDDVAELVDSGSPDVAADLALYALDLLEGAAGMVDDSAGGLQEALGRAEEIHLAACIAGAPDPVALAELLVQRALASYHEVFLTGLLDYESVLGPSGIARYRELVEQAWRNLSPPKPHDYNSRRFVTTYLMEQVAEHTGGTDALIEVLARDASSAYDVLRIAQRLCADGRDDEALEWLDRGLRDFPSDSRLRSLAAECHLRAGRHTEAGNQLWANFTDQPTLHTYIALHDAMGDQFPEWRDRAIAFLTAPAKSQRLSSTLVEILLWEGDTEAAWHAASTSGCHAELHLRLARERAKTHPADAIPVLLTAADQAINHKDRAAYQAAAELLTEARTLFTRCNRAQDFESHVATLRTTHRAKRALREELDRAGLP